MSTRNFTALFQPKSLALIGASQREHSIGNLLLHNVLQSGFAGPVMPVNPKYAALEGLACYPDVASLPQVPDLAVLCIGAKHVPGVIAELAGRGTRAAVVISAGFSELGTAEGKQLEQAMLDAGRAHTMRIVGPNCLGIMVPGIKLNASFAHIAPAPGNLAFVSQSGALCTAVLDMVKGRNIGFSHFVSLGNLSDVDFGDMLDYLAADEGTSAILLYMEAVTYVRKFMAKGREAARRKPVLVIKSGRNKAGAKAAASHTGALIGSDAVYDVAFKRAGMLRVYEMEELFNAVETLARITASQSGPAALKTDSLAIVSNGGGPAVLATDYLVSQGGVMTQYRQPSIDKLNAVLPPTWSHGNPVDIIGDADGKRYGDVLNTVMAAPETEAILVMKCPTAVSDNMEVARAVVAAAQQSKALMLTCWLGAATVKESRQRFAEAGIPTYESPEDAVRAFLHVGRFKRNQAMMMEKVAAPPDFKRDRNAVKAIIARALDEGRSELLEHEGKEVLAAYDIPVVKTVSVSTPDEAGAAARRMGFPVALKIMSPDISHKSDVGGVMLGLTSQDAVRAAAEAMLKTIGRLKPSARLLGFTVQQMVARREGYELIIGMSTDRQFGPVLMFGEGGVAVEALDDKSLQLPPLTPALAEGMITETRVYRRLKGFRDRKPVHMETIIGTLLKVSQLACDVPEITELDINPLVVDSIGGIALDARIKIETSGVTDCRHLAIGE